MVKRILLKLSGEALMGNQDFGLDADTVKGICQAIGEIRDAGIDVAIVVGGGNIFRGVQGQKIGIPEAAAHSMGMLATVMNAIAVQEALKTEGYPAVAMSALPIDAVCPAYARWRALDALAAGQIVVCAAGTGNPFVTTDTGAVLRAIELGADVLLKGTQVDGVYNADPKKDPDAVRYDAVDYDTVLQKGLKVMDATAFAMARDNALVMKVFSIQDPSKILKVIRDEGKFTLVAPKTNA